MAALASSPARQTSADASFSDSDADSTAPCTPDERCCVTPSSSKTVMTIDPAGRWQLAQQAWLSRDSGWVLDGAKDLSRLLKEATAKAHEDVLRPPIVNKLITGNIPLDTHIQYLIMLHCVYESLEAALARHAAHPLLAASYSPAVLCRTQGIAEDIVYFLKLPNGSDWTTHPTAKDVLTNPPRALTSYLERIHSLELNDRSYSLDATLGKPFVYAPPPATAGLLLAHAYVRYMGDLNGGQMIKNSVATAYSIDKTQTEGLRFYRFEDSHTGEAASPALLSKLASSLRKGIDVAGRLMTTAQRAEMLQEANHAFELNVAIFSSFSEEDREAADAFGPVTRAVRSTLQLNQLEVPAGVGIPAIPSPSFEGYAKAATYMPKKAQDALQTSQAWRSILVTPQTYLAVAVLAVAFYVTMALLELR